MGKLERITKARVIPARTNKRGFVLEVARLELLAKTSVVATLFSNDQMIEGHMERLALCYEYCVGLNSDELEEGRK